MSERLRIAVADDEPDIREFLERMLPRCGYEVVGSARNGRELVELALRSKPDLVITDVKMPELDGVEASRRIFAQHRTPVILISAHHDQDELNEPEADFIVGYLVKPIVFADLQPAIREALHRFHRGGEAADTTLPTGPSTEGGGP